MMWVSVKQLVRPLLSPAPALRTAALLAPALALLVSIVPAALSSTVDDPLPGSSPHKKVNRQISVFARMIDDALIESDYALVTRGRNTVGAYVPGQGAVFAFRFSLVDSPQLASLKLQALDRLAELNDLDIYLRHDGDVLVEPKGAEKDRKESDEDKEEKVKALNDKLAAKRALSYVRVKEELAGFCAEYGEMLDAIPGNEWVTLVARTSDGPWGEKKITMLILRVRMSDLRERAEGRIDDAAFRKRIQVEEYGG